MGRPKKEKVRICGIYKIENIANNKVYIGQSIDIKVRVFQHRYKLKYNKHDNNILQEDYNQYGANSFQYSVVEECKEFELDDKERYWMDYYKSQNLCYNILKGGKKDFGDNENNPNAKAVVCIETNTIYKTIKEASEKTGVAQSSISKVVRGLRPIAGGYHWKYENPQNLKKHNNENMKWTEERRKKISESLKKHYNENESYWAGKHLSEDTKKKISKTRLENSAEKLQGTNSYISKQVKCVETNKVFASIRIAQNELKINGIGKALDNPNCKAGGYHWVSLSREEYLNCIQNKS